MTRCPNCDRCLPLVVSGETVQDVYELELIDEDVTTRPVLVVVVETEHRETKDDKRNSVN